MFPVALSGRANSTYNLLVFAGAFVLQWAIGGFIDRLQSAGLSVADAHRRCALRAAGGRLAVAGARRPLGGAAGQLTTEKDKAEKQSTGILYRRIRFPAVVLRSFWQVLRRQ